MVQTVKGFQQGLINPLQALHILAPPNVENALFSRIQQNRSIFRSCRSIFQNSPGCQNQCANIIFITHDPRISFHIGNRGNNLRQFQQISLPVIFHKTRITAQPIQQRNKIDRLAFIGKFQHSIINDCMTALIKVLGRRQNFHYGIQAGRIQQNSAQHCLLRFQIKWKPGPAV